MSDKEKPLPRPPRRPFGPGGRTGKRPKGPEELKQRREGPLPAGDLPADDLLADDLLANEMYGAIAGGRLEEFLKNKFGGNEQAMKLAELMLGLSGMMPPGSPGITISPGAGGQEAAMTKPDEKTESTEPVESKGKAPPEVVEAARRGDAEALIGLLKKEREKLSGAEKPGIRKKGNRKPPETGEGPGRHMEKAVLKHLARIASENGVSLDWVVARALALYVRDYLSTGRL